VKAALRLRIYDDRLQRIALSLRLIYLLAANGSFIPGKRLSIKTQSRYSSVDRGRVLYVKTSTQASGDRLIDTALDLSGRKGIEQVYGPVYMQYAAW
jgi:hypothetical protein